MVRGDDSAGVVDGTGVVIDVGRHQREISSEPCVRVVDRGDDDPEEDGKATENVESGPGRREKRVRVVRHLAPVEGDGTETQSGLHAEQVVDNLVVRENPAEPGEVGQGREHQPGEPVPDEGTGKDVKEEANTGDFPSIRDSVGPGMQTFQHSTVGQHLRPDDIGRFHQPGGRQPSKPKAAELRANDEEHGEPGFQPEVVEVLAAGLDDVGRISAAEAEGNVAHDHDQPVFLDVELMVRIDAEAA